MSQAYTPGGSIWTGRFWAEATERAVKSAAQALIGYAIGGTLDVWNTDWPAAAGVAVGAVALSYLTSIVSAPFSPRGTPSLLPR